MPSIIDLNCFKPVRFTFFLVAGICFYWSAMAQNVKPGFGIESNVMAGRIFKHTKKFQGAIPDISGGGELNLVWKTNGRAAWQQRRNYPTIGLGITYTYYDKNLFGQGIGIYPNLELPLLRRSDWEWTLRFGMSLGYISKQYRPYAPYWDTVNSAMGSRVNNFSLLSSDFRYHLNTHWDIQGGISFTHMSAAKFRLPNLGINLLGAHIGFRYFPNTSNPPKIMRKMPALKNRVLFQMRQGIALTTGESAGSAATPVYISSVSLSKRYWSKNKVLIGLDYAYHQYVYDFMRLQALEPGKESSRAWNAGLYGAHEFLYGRVGLYMQLGVYVRQTLLAKAPIYQRLGMNWYLIQKEKGLIKEMTISTLLKTHFATAELAELGIGIAM
jgi:hypothetical protein